MPPSPAARTAPPPETASASAARVPSYDRLHVEENGVVNQVQQHGQEQAAAQDPRVAQKDAGQDQHRDAERLSDVRQPEHHRNDPDRAVQSDVAPQGVYRQKAKADIRS